MRQSGIRSGPRAENLSGFGTGATLSASPHRHAACARRRTFARRKPLGERQIRRGDGAAFLPDAKAKVELAPFGHQIRQTRLVGLVAALLAGAAGPCRDHLSHLAFHHNAKLVDRAGVARPAGAGVGDLAARQDAARNDGGAAAAARLASLWCDHRDGGGAHPVPHRGGDRA